MLAGNRLMGIATLATFRTQITTYNAAQTRACPSLAPRRPTHTPSKYHTDACAYVHASPRPRPCPRPCSRHICTPPRVHATYVPPPRWSSSSYPHHRLPSNAGPLPDTRPTLVSDCGRCPDSREVGEPPVRKLNPTQRLMDARIRRTGSKCKDPMQTNPGSVRDHYDRGVR